MLGVVIKLEAKVVDPYSDKIVVGTNVTVQHTVTIGDGGKKVRQVESVVFMPPNSVLPLISDVVEAGIFMEPEQVALPENGDLEIVELPDDTD